MGVDLTMNVRAENGLGQLVDRVTRVAQESKRRSRWDFGECLRGHPHHGLVGAQTLLSADATASRIGQDDHLALVDVSGEVRVALVDDRPIGESGDRAWISSDDNRQGLGADGGVSLGRGQGGREGRLVDARLAERPRHVGVGVSGKLDVITLVDAVSRRVVDLRTTKGAGDVGGEIARTVDGFQLEMDRGRTVGPLSSALADDPQAQPDGVQVGILDERDDLSAILLCLLSQRDVDRSGRQGGVDGLDDRMGFEHEVVRQRDLRVHDGPDITQRRLVGVGVCAGGHHRGDGGTIAGDVARQVSEDGRGRHHGKLVVLGSGRVAAPSQKAECGHDAHQAFSHPRRLLATRRAPVRPITARAPATRPWLVWEAIPESPKVPFSPERGSPLRSQGLPSGVRPTMV